MERGSSSVGTSCRNEKAQVRAVHPRIPKFDKDSIGRASAVVSVREEGLLHGENLEREGEGEEEGWFLFSERWVQTRRH